ncbi:MAG: hypothetical protein RL758_2025 [Pseudomonadota bacterium]|jgi:vitamin B12 transporter
MNSVFPRARRGAVALAAVGLCVSLSVQSQEQRLREVVVSASGTEQLLTDALPHTTVIGREQIERVQAVDLPSLLSREAGFQYTQTGGRGQPSTTFLRGAASLQVLVLLDGVPLTKQDSSGAVSLEHIMLDQVERVEVVRGNVSAIHGSGAVGGVIQIFTKKGKGDPQAQVKVEAGSRGDRRVVLNVSGQSGDTRYALGVGGHRTDGFSVQNSDQILNVNPDRDGYRNTTYSLALSQDLARGHSIGLQANGSTGRTEFDSGWMFADPADVHKSETRLHSWTLYSHNQITSQWKSKLSHSEGRERAHYDFLTVSSPFVSRAATRTRTTRWLNEVQLGQWLMTAGAEYQRQHLDSDDGWGTVYDKDRHASAVFAGLQSTLGAHSMQFNLRHDNVQGTQSKTTAYAGYGYAIDKAWKVLASASTAFNAPTLGYLYDPFYGDPALRPESAKSAELGLQYAQGAHLLRMTWFDTRTKDLLLFNPSKNYPYGQFDNVSQASNQGLEVSYSASLGATDVRASLTLQDPKDDNTGQQLVRRARTLASVGATHRIGAWTVGGDVRYTGSRPDAVWNPRLSAYSLVDLTARCDLDKQTSVYGRIENLTDKVYQTAYGYNQPRRGLFVGVNWQPKL